jgi:hypothetical protein
MTYKPNILVEEMVAEIRRDVSMDNYMALREMLTKLAQDDNNLHIMMRFLSEFPELREEFKTKD